MLPKRDSIVATRTSTALSGNVAEPPRWRGPDETAPLTTWKTAMTVLVTPLHVAAVLPHAAQRWAARSAVGCDCHCLGLSRADRRTHLRAVHDQSDHGLAPRQATAAIGSPAPGGALRRLQQARSRATAVPA